MPTYTVTITLRADRALTEYVLDLVAAEGGYAGGRVGGRTITTTTTQHGGSEASAIERAISALRHVVGPGVVMSAELARLEPGA